MAVPQVVRDAFEIVASKYPRHARLYQTSTSVRIIFNKAVSTQHGLYYFPTTLDVSWWQHEQFIRIRSIDAPKVAEPAIFCIEDPESLDKIFQIINDWLVNDTKRR